jgi:predicted ATPase
MLLVLDNCEHVIEAAAALAVDNAQGAPGVRVLATSREPLRTAGEHVHPYDQKIETAERMESVARTAG